MSLESVPGVRRGYIASAGSALCWPDRRFGLRPTNLSFKADGRWNLATSCDCRVSRLQGDTTITRVEVLDANRKTLFGLSGDDLKASTDSAAAVGLKLGPRAFTTVYIWITASSLADLPGQLRHRVTVKSSDDPRGPALKTPAVTIDRRPVMSSWPPPLRGKGWMASNGPSPTSIHRRALLPLDGHAAIGQRFAIDWGQLYPDGESYPATRSAIRAIAVMARWFTRWPTARSRRRRTEFPRTRLGLRLAPSR